MRLSARIKVGENMTKLRIVTNSSIEPELAKRFEYYNSSFDSMIDGVVYS